MVDNSLETRQKFRHGDRDKKKESNIKKEIESKNKTTPEQDAGMKDTKKKSTRIKQSC